MRIAVAQIDVVLFDVDANLARHRDMIERARAERAQVLVFPELSLTGYRQHSHEIGMAYDSPVIGRLARAAGEQDVVWVALEFLRGHLGRLAVG
mgnify:CR=1 FL=1